MSTNIRDCVCHIPPDCPNCVNESRPTPLSERMRARYKLELNVMWASPQELGEWADEVAILEIRLEQRGRKLGRQAEQITRLEASRTSLRQLFRGLRKLLPD